MSLHFKQWIKILVSALFTVLSAVVAHAEFPGYVIRSFETEEGLPQNTVNSIVQTRDGYLWIGTENGLGRFDGVRFTIFGLREGLKSLQIKQLMEDRRGGLWIATRGGGLSRMTDGIIKTFTKKNGLASDYVMGLAEDGEGSLWIATSGGLNRMKRGRLDQFGEKEGLYGKTIRKLFVDRNGKLWVAMSDGVFQFVNGQFKEIQIPFLIGHHRTFFCLLEDRRGRLWASVGDGMLFCRVNDEWVIYGMTNGLPYAYVTSLEEDADGRIWAGSLDEGLYYLDGDQFKPIRRKDGLSDDAIRCISLDREGNLWVGTRVGGLNRMTKKTCTTISADQGLFHEYVRSIAESADGRLWVSTTGGGLYAGKDGKFINISATDSRMEYYAAAEAVIVTRDNSVWLGGWGGVERIKNGILANLYSRTEWPWLRDEGVMAMCEDKTNGIWMGASKSGLKLFRNGKITSFGPEVSVTCILQTPDNVIWYGTSVEGLCRLKNGSVTFYGEQPGLLSSMIRALYMDEKGTLWIGTTGGGLSRFKNGNFFAFTTHEGLVDDTVSQILEDDGFFWLGCTHGVERVSSRELDAVAEGSTNILSPLIIGKSSGMLAEECSSGSQPGAIKTRSGLLCFATVRGVAVIDPKRVSVNPAPPLVMIEDAYVDGHLLPRADWFKQGTTLKVQGQKNGNNMDHRSRLVLPKGGGRLDVHFTAFSYSSPEAIRFRYRIVGLDTEWSNLGLQRNISLVHLPHGKYILHVVACNYNGVWNGVGDDLEIIVPPRLWENWWVVGLAITGGCLAIGLAVQMIMRRKYLRKVELLRHLHELEKERARIAQDLHDDLGNSLTEISLLGSLARGTAPDKSETASYLSEITDKSRKIVTALDEIVWAVNPRNDHLSDLVHYLCLFAQDFLKLTGIHCRLDVSRDLPEIPLDSERRHGLYLAVKEALNNAAKYSKATEVWLRFDERNSILKVVVEDNGKGFDLKSLPPGRNGLMNLRSRLEALGGTCNIASKPGCGTLICFMLPFKKVWKNEE